jgi:UDP-N-acetylmuramyl tripeptide synthase
MCHKASVILDGDGQFDVGGYVRLGRPLVWFEGLEQRSSVPKASSRLDPRLSLAIALAKSARLVSRRLGVGGGTALPGVVASRIDADVLRKLTRGLPRGTVLVTGTNGKTTTSRLLAAMLQQDGWSLVHNRSGANLTSGLATALIERTDLLGKSAADSALFEVDEAMLPSVQRAVRPRVVVLTNLFRDQLDRYGEVDHVASVWRVALAELPPGATVVANADDPAVAGLVDEQRVGNVVTYGVDAPRPGVGLDHFADSKNCPRCGSALQYVAVQYAHLGTYVCPNGDFRRPDPMLRATRVSSNGTDSTEIEAVGPFGRYCWRFGLPGLYNVYNLLAAAAAALALGVSPEQIGATLADFRAAFGRLERIAVGSRCLFFALIKNPVGFTEVLRTILAEPGEKDLAIFINDNLADGTDVSWLWDADVEMLAGRCRSVIVGGTRGADMAVRLKYAGVPTEQITLVDSVEYGLDEGLSRTADNRTLFVLPTYTAMLDLRTIVGRRGYARQFWEA